MLISTVCHVDDQHDQPMWLRVFSNHSLFSRKSLVSRRLMPGWITTSHEMENSQAWNIRPLTVRTITMAARTYLTTALGEEWDRATSSYSSREPVSGQQCSYRLGKITCRCSLWPSSFDGAAGSTSPRTGRCWRERSDYEGRDRFSCTTAHPPHGTHSKSPLRPDEQRLRAQPTLHGSFGYP